MVVKHADFGVFYAKRRKERPFARQGQGFAARREGALGTLVGPGQRPIGTKIRKARALPSTRKGSETL